MKWPSLFLALLAAAPLCAEPVLVGHYPAKVVPEQVSVFSLPERGVVTDRIAEGKVAAGTVFAIVNKKRMQEEREDMEFKLARDRISCRDELRKLQQQREDLVFYLNLSERERRYATPPAEGRPGALSLGDIDERIALTRRELETMEQRARAEFERKQEPFILRMPFDGILQYDITVPEDPSAEMEINGVVQTFATACDDSAFYVTVALSRSDLSQLPGEKFCVSVALPEGRQLRGSFDRRRITRSHKGTDMLVFFFRLAEEDAATAFSLLGSDVTASLFYESDAQVSRVSKAELAAHPAAAECESWAELVERVYPGSVMVFAADRDIVIRPVGGTSGESH